MFDKQYRIYGTHADKVNQLTAVFDETSKAKLFERNLDVLLNAPLVGFMYKTKGEINGKDRDTSIFTEQMVSVQDKLMYYLRLILLLDEEYEPNEEKRLDKAFREFGKDENDLALFDAYVLGGIDIIYDKVIEGANDPSEYINRLYDFVEEFNQRFNEELDSNAILKKCNIETD